MDTHFAARRALLAVLLAATSCCTVQCRDPEEPDYARGTVERWEGGTLRRGRLARPRELGGLPCRGWVHFRADGRLESAELERDTSLAGHVLPEGTRVFLDGQGRLESCWLGRSTVLQGFACRGGNKIAAAFHPDGSLAAFFPPEDVVVDGIPCRRTGQCPVTLHPDGSLAGCELAADARIGGVSARRGQRVRLDAEGRLVADER